MERIKKQQRRFKPSIESKKLKKMAEIRNHPAWKEGVSVEEVHALLKRHEAFTFSLSQGVDKLHYFLSYVAPDGLVKCKNVRIVLSPDGDWKNGNGAGGRYESIDDLVPGCLKVSKGVCKPL